MNISKLNFLKCGVAPVALGCALLAGISSATGQAVTASTGTTVATAVGVPSTDNQATEIIVTGSHIARPQLQSTIPVAVVSSAAIDAKGITNIQDEFKDLPIVGQSADRASSNFQNAGNATATVNLRNLGSSRTLVLINGRRSVGVPGDSAVDLNNIPTDMIDHVEIATGGTSAVYGSDAVAGVVNIILKNKFTGLQLHAQNMLSDKGDAQSALFSVLAGKEFGDGKGHIVANFTYTKDRGLTSSARDFSAHDSPNQSSYAPQGTFYSGNDKFTFDHNNNVKLYQGAAIDGYNRAQNRYLSLPVTRYTGSALGDYEFSPAADLYFEATYTKTKSRAGLEPQAIDDNGNPGQGVINFDGSAFPGIPLTNPYIPAQILQSAIAQGASYIDFRRRSNDIFQRSNSNDRDYIRGVIGLKGDLGSNWKYDLDYEHSQTRDHTSHGAILLTNYGAALNSTTLGGQIVCADAAAQAAGCVPINIFGFNTASAAADNFLSTYTGKGVVIPGATPGDKVTYDYLAHVHQDVATLSLTGSPFKLPGGPLSIAAGAEFHAERSSEVFDPFTRSGYSSSQIANNTLGGYNSKEGYVEVSAPLLGDRPLVHDLTIEAAARYANYTTIGSVWTYKYGGSYAPSRDIRFRAIYARAVRAPNVGELYSAQNQTAPQVTDPCDQNLGKGDLPTTGPNAGMPASATLPAAGCAAIPGIAGTIKKNGYFAYSLAQIQTITGLLGGNPHLQAEATNTFTAGATFTPTFFRNFYLTADYYSIKVRNAVAQVDQQTSVNQCVQTGDPQFCNNVIRDNNGFISSVNSIDINASSYLVSGVDVQARYVATPTLIGIESRIDLGIYYNHKFKQQQTPFAGGPISNELGTADAYSSGQLGTGFKNQFTIDATLTTGSFSLSYTLKYLGPVSASLNLYSIPAYTYHDIQAKFAVGKSKQFEFYVGCNNLLDKQPPFIASGNSQWPGTNTVADTYDTLGRMVYAGIKAKI